MCFEQQQHDHNKQTTIYIYICTHAAFIRSVGRGATPIKQHSQMITCFVFFLLAAAASSQDTLFFFSRASMVSWSHASSADIREQISNYAERKENCAVDENIASYELSRSLQFFDVSDFNLIQKHLEFRSRSFEEKMCSPSPGKRRIDTDVIKL